MTYENIKEWLIKRRPTRNAKTMWKMIYEAVCKQIPQKPMFEGDGYANGFLAYETWICPNCGKRYEVDYDEFDYCPNCGQKIDWGEVSE